jgi:hypothetical protein
VGFLDTIVGLIVVTILVLTALITLAGVLRSVEWLVELRLRFTLQDLLLVFVLVWSAMAGEAAAKSRRVERSK